jgi:hypothetical protein
MATENPTLTQDEVDAFNLAELDEALGNSTSTDSDKKPSNAAPVLFAFVQSGLTHQIVDLTAHNGNNAKQMVAHFNNARKRTRHNILLDSPEYVIPGAYHCEARILADKSLCLFNHTEIAALRVRDAERKAAARS